jgi:ABC-type transport system involved in cytochrome bd biosynthesis fused ATPase/permease subunit
LDPQNAERVLFLLKELAATRAVVLISHNSHPEPGVQRVLRFQNGRISDDREVT